MSLDGDRLVGDWYRLELARGSGVFSSVRQAKLEILTTLPEGQNCELMTALHRFTGLSYVYVSDLQVAIALGATLAPIPRPSPVLLVTSRQVVQGGAQIPEFPDGHRLLAKH